MNERASAIILAAVALVLPSHAAFACSLSSDYKGPNTNFELVAQADTILVGTLISSDGKDLNFQKILVKPTLLIKGKSLPKTLQIDGILSDRVYNTGDGKIRVQAVNSEPSDLWRPHPEVWIGGCHRKSFNQGMQVVLFFQKDGNSLRWFNPAFTRSSEDVLGHNSLWVRAVTIYATISQLPSVDQKRALKEKLQALRNNDALDQNRLLLADDIERQLANVGPVSDFESNSQISDMKRWAYNIANQSYHSRVLPPIRVENYGKSGVLWNLFLPFIGLLCGILIGVVLAGLWRRTRKSK